MFTTILHLQSWVYQHSTECPLHQCAEDCWLGLLCKWLDTDWQQWNKNYIFSTLKKFLNLQVLYNIQWGETYTQWTEKTMKKNVVVSCFVVGILHFPEEVRNQQKLNQDTMLPGSELNMNRQMDS